MKRIYLDNAATTPVDPAVMAAMLPYFSSKFGNASSIHSFGQEARAAVDEARQTIANFLNCKSTEVIFTSGGSESDNLAIKGVIEAIISQNPKSEKANKLMPNLLIPHVITSAFEHHAVLDTIRELEEEGKIEASYIKPDKEGIIHIEDIERAIKPNTVLVSIMYVNNEIGTVQPIREIGKMLERVNRMRYNELGIGQKNPNTQYAIHNTEKNLPKIFFHSDAVQAAEYFNIDVDYLHLDMLTMSAHKIYGPKGTGLLYIRSGVPIKQQIVGGGQEYKKRAGTENVAGIVGFAEAVSVIARSETTKQSIEKIATPMGLAMTNNDIQKLRDKLIVGLLKIPNSFLNGSREHRSPANANISFMNAEGESILLNLDMEGIAASSGSACTSGSLEPSHVLLSIGLKPEECHGSVRFTLGRETTESDINRVLKVLPAIIEKLRKMSPYK